MLLSINYYGNLHETTNLLNKQDVAHAVHSLHYISAAITIVVFKFEEYHSYVYYCDKIGRDVQPPEEFFKGKL